MISAELAHAEATGSISQIKLKVKLPLHVVQDIVCVNSKGAGKTARMRRLAWAFAVRMCDKRLAQISSYLFIRLVCSLSLPISMLVICDFLPSKTFMAS